MRTRLLGLLRRPRIRRAVAASFGTVVALVSLELAAMAVYATRPGGYLGTADLARAREARNTFTRDLTAAECRHVDSLFPHPYLAWVHHATPPCGLSNLSHVGLPGPPHALVQDPASFTLAVLGGSVASHLVNGTKGRHLEEELNAPWRSPTGRPWRIVAGADGAWKQPQQAIFYLLYADVLDAVVTFDGANEHHFLFLEPVANLEVPGTHFAEGNPLASDAFDEFVARYLTARVAASVSRLPVLRRSHLMWLVVDALTGWVERPGAAADGPRTTVRSLFRSPPGLDPEAFYRRNIGKYARYVRSIDVLARANGHQVAHFLQPWPGLEHTTTPEERAVVGDLAHTDGYARMADDLLRLRDEGAPIFGLLDVFRDVSGPIYEDPIHFRREADGSWPGDRLVARRMASVLGEAWALAPRRDPIARCRRSSDARRPTGSSGPASTSRATPMPRAACWRGPQATARATWSPRTCTC